MKQVDNRAVEMMEFPISTLRLTSQSNFSKSAFKSVPAAPAKTSLLPPHSHFLCNFMVGRGGEGGVKE